MYVVDVFVVLFMYLISNLCKEVVFVLGEIGEVVVLFVLYSVEIDSDLEVVKVVWIVLI